MRYNDYSVENGIGEIVDNSVEAGASEIRVYFTRKSRRVGKKEIEEIDKIIIIDNGSGMSPEVVAKCLVLGCSMREHKNGKLGIGRFGVGMTLGSISLARHVEVYSRDSANKEFYYTYIDLDEIHEDLRDTVPEPVPKSIPEEYESFFEGHTGTMVVLSNCDRMDGTGKKTSPSEMNGLIATYVLAWIIEGARKAIEADFHLERPKVVADAIAEYRGMNDWLEHFLEECCVRGDGLEEKSGELYQEYRSYCLRTGEISRNNADFTAVLEKAGYTRKKKKTGMWVQGLQLKDTDFAE